MPTPTTKRGADLDVLPDAELVELAKRKDNGAFRAIMQRHNRRLYRIARSVIGDDSEAEDVLQEAYMRAFGGLMSFRGESSFATWLSRIVLNEALGRLRRRRAKPEVQLPGNEQQASADVIPFPLANPDPERATAQREILVLLERAIDELPEDFRTVLVARMVEGMSIEETASVFGLRAETVKTRVHRARTLLREALEKKLGPALTESFPFDGARCERFTERVLAKLDAGA